jgi:hypothetical protein
VDGSQARPVGGDATADSLRLGTWNCQTGLDSNWGAVEALDADVLVVQECGAGTPAQATAQGAGRANGSREGGARGWPSRAALGLRRLAENAGVARSTLLDILIGTTRHPRGEHRHRLTRTAGEFSRQALTAETRPAPKDDVLACATYLRARG